MAGLAYSLGSFSGGGSDSNTACDPIMNPRAPRPSGRPLPGSGKGMAMGMATGMDLTVKIAIVDESPVRSAILEEGLREAGFTEVIRIAEMTNLLARIYQLEQMFQVSRIVKRPIAMFVDQSDTASIQASVDAGVASYIVDGLKKERIKYILDTCISRFNAFAKLQDELDRTKNALEERKVIDRAKGILMTAKKMSEEDAYALLRSTAMKENKKIAEIAQSVITASEMFK